MTVVRRLTTLLLASLAAGALLAQAPAQTQTQTTGPAPRAPEAITAETDRDAQDPRALRLTLRDAIGTAIQQNLGVQLQNYEYRIVGQNLRAAHGVFDFLTDASVTHGSSRVPTDNPFEPAGGRSTGVFEGSK